MKNLFGFILFIIIACSDKPKSKEVLKEHLSIAQQTIQNLVDSFKAEYKFAESPELRENLFKRYNQKLGDYLYNNNIDSIRVHVDTIIIKGLAVTTKFHCNKDIAFQYTMYFKKNMPADADTLLQFMKNLQFISDTTINFAFGGSHELNDPFNLSLPTLKIFAFPMPKFTRKD